MFAFKLLITLLPFAFIAQTTNATEVICYWYEYVSTDFTPEDIDVTICTQVHYAFMKVYENATLDFLFGDDRIKSLSALKTRNPDLKVVITIGSARTYSKAYSMISADPALTTLFIQNTLKVIQDYDLDGAGIDWHYPAQSGGVPEDQTNMVTLLTAIQEAFHSNGNDYLLVSPVYKDPTSIGYHVNAISKVVDYVNIMSTDYYAFSTGNTTGHNCPLYASANEDAVDANTRNVASSINNWLTSGVDPSKLIVNVASYGRTFQLANVEDNGVFAPTLGAGKSDFLGYSELCQMTDGWTNVWDENALVPYKYNGDQWMSYDDPISIALKTIYIMQMKLAGVGIWSINTDDVAGVCGPKNVLINTIKNNL